MADRRRRRGAELPPEDDQRPEVIATPEDKAQQSVRRDLAMMPLELRIADVCRRCGRHTIADEAARIKFMRDGGETTCVFCGLTKAHTGVEA